jgi:hypothetical protein
MTTKKSVEETYDENAEVSRTAGVRPKGTPRPKPPGKPPPKPKTAGKRTPLLLKYRIVVSTVNTIVGLGLIYAFVEPATLQVNAMWVFGAVNAIAMASDFFHKRE